MHHQNIGTFYGLTTVENSLYIAMEYELNGLLHEILHGGRYDLDDNFKYCLSLDVATGMIFLHSKGIVCGNLSSQYCIIDSKWNVKVANWLHCPVTERENVKLGYGLPPINSDATEPSHSQACQILTQAPEILSGSVPLPNKQTDVYSFGMLVVEIFSQCEPFGDAISIASADDIIQEIVKNNLRPVMPRVSQILQRLLKQCWNSDAAERPNFTRVQTVLKHARPSRKGLLDCMMDVMKNYVEKLEDMVKDRTVELTQATDSMRTLLYQILPPKVAEKLQRGEAIDPENYDSVTVFFSDIVGFTTISALSTPLQIVHFLNSLYSCFDAILDKHDVYKVETIGDAYMVISGLPERNGIRHAACIADMAIELMEAARNYTIPHLPDEQLQLRAGIHSGPVAAGVVGVKMPRFCLFGDTVNTASRMESTSVAMRIQVSGDFRDIARQVGGYEMQRRGTVSVKGKGDMVTFWLLKKTVDTNEPLEFSL
ncbi:hypothetical protein CAPTEDRAFT_143601 [Capitella teleta]|uniref:Guanylate cyclase n=1 Tax=Capitella teleta TaxID=283909 RepID=R7U1S3_CAPTE|nr:hypothetical protein CAPTEDRAFT_143601 [Capitella teleta]|eukprot:ELT99792.1 hypothetical protein CAPTEDRAFT_143601 [Capitella teleta]